MDPKLPGQQIIRCLLLFFCTTILFARFAFSQQPNVILIFTDDQGSIDLNCYGSTDLHTPHIDRLAEEGIKFTQFYAAAPLCSPSRAALMTGLNPHAAGLPGNASSFKGNAGMPSEKVTIAEALKTAGYVTGHVGKWHLGFTPETMPNGQGFDYSFGHMGGCIDNYSHFFYWNGPNRHDLYENGEEVWADGKYFPDLMAEKADEFVRNNRNKPFFLYYAINLPHYPVQPTEKWRKYYKDLPHPRSGYAGFISVIDERVGQLMKTLDELGIRENTLIIFQSDHGHSMEVRNFGGGGNAGPFRGAKTSLFEGGIRVPAIISMPGTIPQGEERDQMTLGVDWFPTILDYCGLARGAVEGKSIKPIIEDPSTPGQHEVFRWKQGVSWAVRKGDWKLLGYPRDPANKAPLDPDEDALFLVNIKEDHTEMTNLASKYPEKLQELQDAYMEWEFADPDDLPEKRITMTSIAKDKSIELVNQPHKNYFANGGSSLLDEKLGTRMYRDGFWLGFEQEDLVATIDLGNTEQIKEVIIGTLQDPEVWIFFPEYAELSWSNDGMNYSDPIRINVNELEDKSRKSILRITIAEENVYGRYLNVKAKNIEKCPEWHTARGQKAWLFIDEITVR